MQYIVSIWAALLLYTAAPGQPPGTLKLTYDITQKSFRTDPKGIKHLISQQKMLGYFIKKDNRYFFYATPLDTGTAIKNNIGSNYYVSDTYLKDSLQMVQYRDADSGYQIVSIPRAGSPILNRFPIIWGYQKWKILPETKKIGTFQCQKAIWYDDGEPAAEIWFTPDIPVYFALQNFNEVPGLVVEATLLYPHIEFKLLEYQANVPVREEEVFPAYMRGKANIFSKEDYLRGQQRIRNLRKTQGRSY
ncbi:MAG: GLPGLI family protein [Lacibacter sp.]|jgi:hypothetical protein